MELRVLGSSSKGNCYILQNENEALILEAGVRFAEVKRALGFNIRKVVGCLITHQHNDHAHYIKQMAENGFYTLALPEVFEAKALKGSRCVPIKVDRGYKLGRFKVIPFPACHDVPCVGYFVEHPEMGRMMFLTDSCDCLRQFPGLNHVLIECNYSTPKLYEAVKDGRTLKTQIERLPNSHMELQTCKAVLQDMDLSDVVNVVLIHLSDNNSDRPYFISEIERLTGKIVNAAYPGLNIELIKY